MLTNSADVSVPRLSGLSGRIATARRLLPSGLAIVVPLVAMAWALWWDWGRPGLYMDAINPEYLGQWVLHGSPSTHSLMPGNALFGRLPVFTGSVYHGSTQLYFSLPFVAVFGFNLAAWRVVQFVAAGIMLLLVVRLISNTLGPARRRGAAVLSLLAALGLVADPAFSLALRTQAYSCLFPMMFLLGSLVVLRLGTDTDPGWRRRVAAGVLYGLAAFSYFIFLLFAPAMLFILWRSAHPAPLLRRLRCLVPWLVGTIIGYSPFILGMFLIARALGGISQARQYLAGLSDTLHVGPQTTGFLPRIEAPIKNFHYMINGEWVSLMILAKPVSVWGDVRAAVGLTLIVVGFLLSLWRRFDARYRHAQQAVVALLVSFMVVSVLFGDRLAGHHFSALMPLWYLAIALSLAIIAEVVRGLCASRLELRVANRIAWSAIVAVTAGIALCGLGSQVAAHREIRRSGGALLYSQAVTQLAVSIEDLPTHSTVYTPDWGYGMELEFLAGDKANVVFANGTPARVHASACVNRPVAIIATFPSALDAAALAAKSMTAAQPRQLWLNDAGVPLIQVDWFMSDRPC
ncbi:MAG: glycosyl transferase family protein [Frankiales bacterium]|nr:glycosyl transferase family protein [Frankiales bacterium]